MVDHRFRLLEEIGRGGMSTVYRGEDLTDGNRTVAVKVPLPVFSSGVGAWSMFQREAEILAALEHPSIVRFVAAGKSGPRSSYLVTEHVEGTTLAALLQTRGAFAEEQAVEIARRLCEAVEHMHARGFVHYDVKPGNVILTPNGTIKLIDFGLAHEAAAGRFAWPGRTPPIASSDYVAPEQIQRKRGRKSVDVYAIGVVLYELLTGRPPFPGDDPFVVASARLLGDPPAPRALEPRVSRAVEEIALRALRREPAERYASVTDMRRDLERPEAVVVTGLANRLQPVTPGRRRARLLRYVAAVALTPLGAQILLFLLLWRHFARR
ncbi:MAG TPA: serine/threonine-protein kinase [Polyangia bacterium]|nr:serine/threonine-protein kinase [Polyangia bacterium]